MSQNDLETDWRNIQRWISTYEPFNVMFDTTNDRKVMIALQLSKADHSEKFDALVKSADFSWMNAVDTITKNCLENKLADACYQFERAKSNFWEKVHKVLKRASEDKHFHESVWNSRVNSVFVVNLFACLEASTRDVVVYKEEEIFSEEIEGFVIAFIELSCFYVEKCIEVCFTFHKGQRQLIWSQIQERLHHHSEVEAVWGFSNFLRLVKFRFVITEKEAEVSDKDHNRKDELKKLRVKFLKNKLLPLYKRPVEDLFNLQLIVKWFIGGDARLTILALGVVCREVERPSHHVDGDCIKIIDQRFDSIRQLTTSLDPAKAVEYATEILACLKPLWSSESTLRIYKCLDLLIDESFENLYGPHLQTYAPHMKASIMGFLGDTRGCENYQLTCFEVYRVLYLEGSVESECRSFSSNYAKKLKVALQSNRLNVTYDWLNFLRYRLFRQTVLPAVIEAMPDFWNWLNIVKEDTSDLNLSGHEEKIRHKLRQNLEKENCNEWPLVREDTVDLKDLCRKIFAFKPRNISPE